MYGSARLIVALIVALASIAEAGDEYRVIQVTGAGKLIGTVRMAGDVPEPRTLTVTRDKAVCGQEQTAQDLFVNPENMGLKNVVVSIPQIAAGKSFVGDSELVISQIGCVYEPHVQVYRPQSRLTIRNNDDVLHNIHAFAGEEVLFNVAQPSYVKRWPIRLLETDSVIRVQCDVHEWMDAYLVPATNPYFAVTDNDGAFELDQLPAGTHTLQVWHETLGISTREVTVTADVSAVVNFELSIPASKPVEEPEGSN